MATEQVRIQRIGPSEGYWQFFIPGESENIRLSMVLSQAGTQKNQARGIISARQFHPASYKEFFSAGSQIYDLRNAAGEVGREAELARKFLMNGIRNHLPNTGTRLVYTPINQKDAIIHNFGTSFSEEMPIDFVGESEIVLSKLPLEVCLALTGQTPERASEIMSYLKENTPVYVWRFNKKPEQREERVARLGAYSNWAYLSCVRLLDDRYSAFRVSREKNSA